MTNPTRQEMLSAIDMKIARTGGGTGPGETGYYLPVMIEDILNLILNQSELEKKVRKVMRLWGYFGDSIDKQSDDCISFIFNLLSNAK